jgi:hypothetical protein
MSELKKGIPFSDEHKEHLAEKRRLRITKPETLEKMHSSMLGKNTKYKYTLLSPNGKEYTIDSGLKFFCKEHEITRRNLLTRGYAKGWKILKKEPLW